MQIHKRGKNYYLDVRVGKRRIRKSLRTRDKRVAQQLAQEIIAQERRQALGLPLHHQLREASVQDALEQFSMHLIAKGNTDAHNEERLKHLNDFRRFAKLRRVTDLKVSQAEHWLALLSADGLSHRSVNKRRSSLIMLGHWLEREGVWPSNPLTRVPRRKEAEDRRKQRRALTPEEFNRLVGAARRRPYEEEVERRSSGSIPLGRSRDLQRRGALRALVYSLLATTGLRTGELKALRWWELNERIGLITLPASKTKNRKVAEVWVHPRLLPILRRLRQSQGGSTRVIPKGEFPTVRTFYKDLNAAGIERVDAAGKCVDLHALRTSLVTWLQMTGAGPAVAKEAARHAKMETTMQHYTDPKLLGVQEAIKLLPIPELAEGYELCPDLRQEDAGTGTPSQCLDLTPLYPFSNGTAAKPQAAGPGTESQQSEVAGVTGLEPATSGLTGRRSNQTELHPRVGFAAGGF